MQQQRKKNREWQLDAVGQRDESIEPSAKYVWAGFDWAQRLRMILPSIAPITSKRET
jgi:hypothetical protein